KLLTTGASEEMQRRLVREAEAAGRLQNRNVVDMLEVGTAESGEPFLVMELLNGRTLRSVIKRQRRLDPKLAATIIRDICHALRAAHAGNVVHRDLKPSNVVLHETPEGIVLKVLDFGVSKVLAEEQQLLTNTGIAVGSPAYMSPEQARGARVDHRADLWSVGVWLFEMVAGRRPFAAESPAAMLSMILFSEIPRVSQFCATLDPVLEEVVTRCLQRKVSERYQSADDIIAALDPLCLPEIVIEAPAPPRSNDRSEFTGSASVSLSVSDELTGSASQASIPSSSSSSSSAHATTTASNSHSTTHGVAMTPGAHVPLPTVQQPPSLQTRLQWVAASLAILLLAAVSALVLIRAVRGDAQGPVATPSEPVPAETQAATPAAQPVPTVAPTATAPPVVTAQPVVTAVPVSPPPADSEEPESDVDEAAEAPPSAPAERPAAAPAEKPEATATEKPAAAPRPAVQPRSAPEETKKPCASPIVDANGKVVGCL
nr:protein kinase [Polyangiaceae bacterium]